MLNTATVMAVVADSLYDCTYAADALPCNGMLHTPTFHHPTHDATMEEQLSGAPVALSYV